MNTNSVPRWILFYSAFLALFGLLFSLAGFFAPQLIFADAIKVDFGSIRLITGFFAGRSLATSLVLGMVLLKKDAKALFLIFVIRLLTEIMDTIVMVATGSLGMSPVVVIAAMGAIFLVPETLALSTLAKMRD
jgi:hypothetical protein